MPGKGDVGRRVRITQDCREGSPATGSYGVYEGDFPRSVFVILSKKDGDFRELDYEKFLAWNAKQESPIPILKGRRKKPDPPYWFPSDNPRIKLDDGTIIWGDECWWSFIGAEDPPMEVLQEGLQPSLDFLSDMISAIQARQQRSGANSQQDIDAEMQRAHLDCGGKKVEG